MGMDSSLSEITQSGVDTAADSSADAIKYEPGKFYPELFALDPERAIAIKAFDDATPVEISNVSVDEHGDAIYTCKVVVENNNGMVDVVETKVAVSKELLSTISESSTATPTDRAELMPVVNRLSEHRKLAAYSESVRANPQHAARLDRVIGMLRSGQRHKDSIPAEVAGSGLYRMSFEGPNAPRLYYRVSNEGLEIWGETSFNDDDSCRHALRSIDWSE
jgi:hypothetical protein